MGKAKDKSSAAHELMEYGGTFALLEQYRNGRLSLGRLAEELNVSISEAMDLLAEHGVHAHLTEDDLFAGLAHLKTLNRVVHKPRTA